MASKDTAWAVELGGYCIDVLMPILCLNLFGYPSMRLLAMLRALGVGQFKRRVSKWPRRRMRPSGSGQLESLLLR
jgi:hypothetical protein